MIDELIRVMARLRDPQGGCPWDLEQTFETICPYTIEEAYEVVDAVARGDIDDLRDELGDLLLQVVYHARMAEEGGHFDFAAVANGITRKMIARHPHVFGTESVEDAAAQTRAWEDRKAAERAERAAADGRRPSRLDGVALGLPALMRAAKLQKRAARGGFDWDRPAPVLAKIDEERAELAEAMRRGEPRARLAEELGDLLFAVVNLARHLDIEAEEALRAANAKFERRFRAVETAADLAAERDGLRMEDRPLAELDTLWEAAKAAEKSVSPSEE